MNPLHPALIPNLGVTMLEILDLRDLAAQCAEDGVYGFLYTASPLTVERGAGAPANPVAVETSGGDDGDGDGGD